jgi:hypothetical protein
MNEIANRPDDRPSAQTLDDVIARGDLSKLTPEQCVEHYFAVCKSAGLNPLTQPLQWMTLQGKKILYCNADGADQLRRIHGINIAIPTHSVNDAGLLTVFARAIDKNGRTDEDYGVVSVAGLKGEAAANAFMKAVTKAKRRVTLSISGLGLPDELDLEGFAAAAAPRPLPQLRAKPAAAGEQGANVSAPAATATPAKTGPTEIKREGDTPEHWSVWATTLMGFVRLAPDVDTINEWTVRNADHLEALKLHDGAKFTRLIDMINHQIEVRNEAGS